MRSIAHLVRHGDMAARTYQLTDRLHAGRTVHVSADGIVTHGLGLVGGAWRVQPLG